MNDDIRQEIADAYGIPATFAHRLVGETRKEMERDARSLAPFFREPPEHLSGGLSPEDTRFDPVEAVRAARRRKY
ncbi:hypothetical protein [Streptomyces althioticus]|uniref:hypothetical protein n=1 Tax=Streptomyces althioticus TaxID=83380 RepID=UPI00331EB1B9